MKEASKGISTVVSIILMVIIVIILANFLILFFLGFFTAKTATAFEIVDVYCNSVIIRNIGTEPITSLKVKVGGEPATVYYMPTILPGEVKEIYINRIINATVTVISSSAILNYPAGPHYCPLSFPHSLANIGLVAYSTPHWVIFNYSSGKYLIYASSDGDLIAEEGPIEGDALILENINNYTIQTSWSSWEDRPVDTPIIIVRNPNPTNAWIFNWTDPHGSFLFYISPLNVLDDFLIFWEDLYNPFNPPGSVDDWKDHVVRVSLQQLSPPTYRIAVFLAKGGYKHEFWLNVITPTPLDGIKIYEKAYGETISNKIGDYYYEIPEKTFTVQVE